MGFDYDPDYILEHVDKIITLLSKDDRQIFLRCFLEFKEIRESTIQAVEEIRADIDSIKSNTDIVRSISTGVGIVGGLATLLGYCLSLNETTKDVGDEIAKYGTYVGAGGGAVSLAAAGANSFSCWKKVNAAKRCIQLDQCKVRDLFPLFERTETLEEHCQAIFGCSIVSDTYNDLWTVLTNIDVLIEEGNHTFVEIGNVISRRIKRRIEITKINKSFSLREIETDVERLCLKTQLFLRDYCQNPNVREAVRNIRECCRRSSFAIEMSKIIIKIKHEMLVMQRASLFTSLLRIVQPSPHHVAASAINVTLVSIKLAIDAIVIISTAEDIAEKKSEYSEMLRKINVLLSAELRKMTVLYDSIKAISNN